MAKTQANGGVKKRYKNAESERFEGWGYCQIEMHKFDQECKRILIELVNNSNEGDEDILRSTGPAAYLRYIRAAASNRDRVEDKSRKWLQNKAKSDTTGRHDESGRKWDQNAGAGQDSTEVRDVAAQERDHVAAVMCITNATDDDKVDVWLEALRRSLGFPNHWSTVCGIRRCLSRGVTQLCI
ncbi:hypothetical protein V500_02828 [Pseudogymnoascus sp. VKM F-4518 (FW-2643)]|nr:hypothetical protein V500_02828 [Pseudogymnoascus sp. VKM F-4518 (FW-2643)]